VDFESLLTTFEGSIIFRDSWGRNENWLKMKEIKAILTKLSLSESVKCSALLNLF